MACRLGVNIDHVATLRQARGGSEPDLGWAVREAALGGADGITAHLREDRRHIQDRDLATIRKNSRLPFNLEMALVPEIIRIALAFRPEKVCVVPEKRQELTTEGGLDAYAKRNILKRVIPSFKKKGIQVSLFVDPSEKQIRAAKAAGADAVEIHTGAYANAERRGQACLSPTLELRKIRKAARLAKSLGLMVHAGHGINYKNILPLVKIPEIEEFNIGHSIISRAVFVGLRKAVREMKRMIRYQVRRGQV